MVEFNEIGVGECSNCGMAISHYDRYCGYCGILLPLPSDLDLLEKREDGIPDLVTGSHEEQKGFDADLPEEARHKYCPQCGKKL